MSSKEKEVVQEATNGRTPGLRPFLIGLATGGAAALLLTPKTGSDMRRDIAQGAAKARDEASALAKSTSEKAAGTYRDVSERAKKVVNETKASAENHRQALREAFEEGRQAYRRELEKAG